jgi:hypothetical protein
MNKTTRWSETESGKARIAKFNKEIENANKRVLQIIPSNMGAYAYDPETDSILGNRGSKGYIEATRP